MKNETIIQGIISLIAIIGISYGRLVSFPDAESRIYGLPFNWGTHQLVSIAGPVDIWSVNISNLVLDLAFWFVILLAAQFILDLKK
jgi:hypothetical protein